MSTSITYIDEINIKDDPKQDQNQSQDQKQAELQAQAQAQLNLQGQGQGQGQGQSQWQTAVQYLDSKSENDNKNSNENDNKNSNENKNSIDNKVDNSIDNKVDNSLDNKVDNKVSNVVDNKVNVDVDVKIDVKADGLSSPVIDLSDLKNVFGSVIMPDVVNQKMDDGNQFNIDQVNNLVDIDASFASLSYDGKGGDVKMDAKAHGGFVHVDSKIDDIAGNISASANAAVDQSAFNQTITQGANIQFISIEMSVAGDSLDTDLA